MGKFRGFKKVIFNGTDGSYYDSVVPADVGCDRVFLAVSKWRPHKRLVDTIESFLLADIEGSVLCVVGDVSRAGISMEKLKKRYFSRSDVRYFGVLNQRELASLIKCCVASIHLCWVDCCPNSVVEVIAAQKPVITNNVGGTCELVERSGGIVCDIDSPYDLRPVKLYSPPKIDRRIVADAMVSVIDNPSDIVCEHVDIKNVALQYLQFFKRVLK